MGLFNKKEKLPEFMSFLDEPVVDFESALAYLKGLSDDDFEKVVSVARIHRKAQQEAAEVLECEMEPTTYIDPPILRDMPQYETLDDSLLDDDEIDESFLDDEPSEDLINDIKVIESSEKPSKAKAKS